MTAISSEERAFRKAIDADPEDTTTLLVFADWLEERGDPRVGGYRELVARNLNPKLEDTGAYDQWTWFASRRHEQYPIRDADGSVIPDRWFDSLRGGECVYKSGNSAAEYHYTHWRDYRLVSEAMDAAARAWALLQQGDRQ